MSDLTTIELTTLLPPKMMERLQAEAERQQLPLPELVRDAIETYLEEIEEIFEDTPDEKILADLKEALGDALAGRTRPIEELFAEVDQEMADDAHTD